MSNLGITALSLTGAKGNELKLWIELTNKTTGKRVLSKTGKVEELRHRLAAHYCLDLTSNPETVSAHGPLPLDEYIQRHQWDHLRSLGNEWTEATSTGKPFTLCPGPGQAKPKPVPMAWPGVSGSQSHLRPSKSHWLPGQAKPEQHYSYPISDPHHFSINSQIDSDLFPF